jgi:hypothetical protein
MLYSNILGCIVLIMISCEYVLHSNSWVWGFNKYCNVDGQSVPKQRLGKQNLNITETVFYGVRAATVAMQWFGKHVSTMEDGVFRGVRASRQGTTTESSSTCEDLKCDLKTLCVL